MQKKYIQTGVFTGLMVLSVLCVSAQAIPQNLKMQVAEIIPVQECGNGTVEGNEECDAGERNQPYTLHRDTTWGNCWEDCTLKKCGDGRVDMWIDANNITRQEECDAGENNSNEPNALCRTNCTLPYCGDGIPDNQLGEQCGEPGLHLCDATAELFSSGEQCNEKECICQSSSCGNGIVDGYEECDYVVDSNCTLQCTVPVCGDGILTTSIGEECDTGFTCANGLSCNPNAGDKACADGTACAFHCTAACTSECKKPACLNAVVECGEECEPVQKHGECEHDSSRLCDPTINAERWFDIASGVWHEGHNVACNEEDALHACIWVSDDPTCTIECNAIQPPEEEMLQEEEPVKQSTPTIEEIPESHLECIDFTCTRVNGLGVDNCAEQWIPCGEFKHTEAKSSASSSTSSIYIITEIPTKPPVVDARAICSNSILETGEECDDGNSRDADGCSAECLLEFGICGDGMIQTLLNEQCEKSLHKSTLPYYCVDCRNVSDTCGDGTLDAGEECDEGAENSEDADANCRTDCSVGRCGDGIIDSTEQCDDGNRVNEDGCDSHCTVESSFVAQAIAFPYKPDINVVPLGMPLTQIQPRMALQAHAPAGDTGPAAVVIIGAGTAAGWSWMRKQRK